MDKERKTYETEESKLLIAAEPIVAYGNDQQTALLSSARNVRGDVARAITGETLLFKLRPRIQSLFGNISH
jgi:hypothetical protein